MSRYEPIQIPPGCEDWDRILRGSVPDRYKDVTSAVGAVQNYIAELECHLTKLGIDVLNLDGFPDDSNE